MPIAPSPAKETLVPAVHVTPYGVRQIEDTLAEVAEAIAPVWPLKDYVAVNPYAGISHRSFLDARTFLKVFSDCETLMPMEHYAAEFHRGKFSLADIESAMAELAAVGVSQTLSAVQVAENLRAIGPLGAELERCAALENHDRPIRTVADYATSASSVDWAQAIVDEVSKHCSAHYDQGQAIWSSPYKDMPLYQAWRSVAQHDYNIEVLGLNGFRKFVSGLPHTPQAAIVYLLQRLRVPPPLWSTFLLCQLFSIPGWSAWAKYQTNWRDGAGVENNDLSGLLAMRLAYDAALAEAQSLSLDWSPLVGNRLASFKLSRATSADDSMLRYTLLRASEIGYRDNLLKVLSLSEVASSETGGETGPERKLAQMVFCIDVRSERIRRQLESQSSVIETFGFAGFFGMAFEFVKLGQATGDSHLPVLLKPQFRLHEGLHEVNESQESWAISQRRQMRGWRALWKSFQTSAVSCFSFVETTGLLYGFKLLGRATGYKPRALDAKFDGVEHADHDQLGPTLRGLNQQGITTSRQVEMVEGMLRNLGLTKDFAQLVVFCGHASQTENNPLAAGLDCGACGGHSGEPNARFAALLLNQAYIRHALAERGIKIPADTHFLGTLHNTTTDAIEFFDVDEVPAGQQAALQELRSCCEAATKQTKIERLPVLASNSLSEILKRASDWSEVRPEWGLAGNAAFIAAPRSVTQCAKLDARTFLHSYDFRQDTEGSVLEAIMTAPMVVAHWINMQYYASTVDGKHFGSGNKTIHNVVGQFGILSGNGGDLMTGLPWQSLHTGEEYQHQPLRLQVVIAATRELIDRVIAKHELVANLFNGAWLHLIAIECSQAYRYLGDGEWEQLHLAQAAELQGVLQCQR